MAYKSGIVAAGLVALIIAMLAEARSESEGVGEWSESRISGAWSKPDSRTVVLTVDEWGDTDVRSEISVTETSESVIVSVRFYVLTQEPSNLMFIAYQLPFDLKAPLGKRKIFEPTAEVPKHLSAQPDSRYYQSIPVKVIRTS